MDNKVFLFCLFVFPGRIDVMEETCLQEVNKYTTFKYTGTMFCDIEASIRIVSHRGAGLSEPG